MDLIQDAFSLYMIFCITTLVCIIYVQYKAFKEAKVSFSFGGSLIYYTITAVSVVLLAPIFFIVFMFRSDSYFDSLVEWLEENIS